MDETEEKPNAASGIPGPIASWTASDTEKLGRLSQSYQLVEGVVAKAGEADGRVYLNFTKDWRTDFTIAVEPKDVPAFTAAGLDLRSLTGRRVRVRGWMEWRNGPMIVADHPEQIEVLPKTKIKLARLGSVPRRGPAQSVGRARRRGREPPYRR
jgi:hypothetical protein